MRKRKEDGKKKENGQEGRAHNGVPRWEGEVGGKRSDRGAWVQGKKRKKTERETWRRVGRGFGVGCSHQLGGRSGRVGRV